MNYRFMFHLFVFLTIPIILLKFTEPKARSDSFFTSLFCNCVDFYAVIIQNKDFISQLVMAISQNSHTSNIPKMAHESISINNLIASNSGTEEDINAIAFLSRNKPFYQKVISNYELKSSFVLIHNDHYAF